MGMALLLGSRSIGQESTMILEVVGHVQEFYAEQ
jgi:hypothetical protein